MNTPAPLPPLDPCPFCPGEVRHDTKWPGYMAHEGEPNGCPLGYCGFKVDLWNRRPSSTGDAGAVSPGVPDGLREALALAARNLGDARDHVRVDSPEYYGLVAAHDIIRDALASGEKGGTP